MADFYMKKFIQRPIRMYRKFFAEILIIFVNDNFKVFLNFYIDNTSSNQYCYNLPLTEHSKNLSLPIDP